MPRNPNPQGKGLVPVLQGLQQHLRQPVLVPKQIDQIEMELFTSLFVLQSALKFNPVAGQSYWMYEVEGGYRLLMVAPDEWLRPYSGRCIGECVLQDDRTWTLALQPALAADTAFLARIDTLRRRMQQALERATTIEAVLPVYEEGLGYHGRIMAFILGKSLLSSMQLSGIKGLDYKAARGLLTHLDSN